MLAMPEDKNHPFSKCADDYYITPDPTKRNVCLPDHTGGIEFMPDFEEVTKNQAANFEQELLAGFKAIREYPKSVTFFGSARLNEDNEYYQHARELSHRICASGFAVITGGGPGIMEAANRGANETCGYSIGFNIVLPSEQTINKYVTHGVNFQFFSARKMALYYSAEAYLYYPGGYGTLDELFQLLTLIQTEKAPKTPIILVGSAYWNHVDSMIKETLLNEFKTISPEDPSLYSITDDIDEIMGVITRAPLRTDYSA